MTAKQIFEYALVELNKREAPSLLLEDYNYFINKAVNQYINRVYNLYDINQQKSDDLRVLKSSTVLIPTTVNDGGANFTASSLFNKTYEVELPDDYLHVLNCVVEYELLKTYKCYNQGSFWHQGATRLTADMFSQIINNYYLRPCYKRPYYYINNVNTSDTFPTTDNQTPIIPGFKVTLGAYSSGGTLTIVKKTGVTGPLVLTYGATDTTTTFSTYAALLADLKTYGFFTEEDAFLTYNSSNVANGLYINNVDSVVSSTGEMIVATSSNSLRQRVEDIRYGNKSKVRMEIRYGKDNATFKLNKVFIDYLKAPQFIRLTQDQIDEVEDTTQILEFPDYVCQEVVNELIKLLMENSSDPRLQSHIPINTSIATPGQEQPKK